MQITPETQDMFFQEAERKLQPIFSGLSSTEQVRVLRQLIIDLVVLKEKSLGNVFSIGSFTENLNFWLDDLQDEAQRKTQKAEKPLNDPQSETNLKATYLQIQHIFLNSSIAIEMTWPLFSQLLEACMRNLSAAGLTQDPLEEYLKRLDYDELFDS